MPMKNPPPSEGDLIRTSEVIEALGLSVSRRPGF